MIIVKYAFFILLLITAGLFDFKKRIIPDFITIPGTILGIAFGIMKIDLTLFQSVTGAAAGGGFLLLIGLIFSKILKKEAIGGGDVKLCFMVGSFLGVIRVFEVIFASSFLAVFWILTVALIMKQPVTKEIPYGFFLSLAGIVIVALYHI